MDSAQLSLYIALCYAHRKRQQRKAAVLLIQAWWKLVLQRIHHRCLGTVVVEFHSQQSKYRQVLQACRSVPYRRLQWEVGKPLPLSQRSFSGSYCGIRGRRRKTRLIFEEKVCTLLKKVGNIAKTGL